LSTHNKDSYYFEIAFDEAKKAFKDNEVPVGCVLIKDNKIIAKEYNRILQKKNPTAHAELLVIQKAAKELSSERLSGCKLYTTLEPCTMCTGALILARIEAVFFLAIDNKLPGLREISRLEGHNHSIQWEYIPMKKFPSSKLLKDFFRKKRKR